MAAVTVIVPLAADEDAWRELLPRLPLPADWELLLAAAAPPPADWQNAPPRRWIHCPRRGRGAQMNAAAAAADGELLWFVHADSRPPANFASALSRAAAAAPRAVYYFDLHFYDGGARMILNEWGARLRCALFGNPFGDQALSLRRDLFWELGGYPEDAAAGEDHLFVLRAARAGARARRVGAAVGTSARTYLRRGWWRTVREYQKIWWRQWRG
ncbi:MAG: glycosyltransferase [Gammaproteobacteria bacterium]